MPEHLTFVCPYCKRKFEVSSADLQNRYKKSGMVPIFCTAECELRFSSNNKK